MVSTWPIQPLQPDEKSGLLAIDAINDIMGYLNCEVSVVDGYAFLKRDESIPEFENEKDAKKYQHYNNNLPIAYLLDRFDNDQYARMEVEFEKIIQATFLALKQRLIAWGINDTHEAVIVRDEIYGDVDIVFIKSDT